ncbi:MAG TPA: hypothetical protein VJX67_14930 [Blastocatellia bacterium]|nr:hypothetical protein [Blastocatellia bacterium]
MKTSTRVRAILAIGVLLLVIFVGSYIFRSRTFPVHTLVWVGRDGPEEGTPDYALYLRGAVPNEIQFTGERLVHRYVAGCRCYQVYGIGDLEWRSNTIHIEDGLIKINGQVLAQGRIHDFVVEQDGHFAEGFIRTAD